MGEGLLHLLAEKMTVCPTCEERRNSGQNAAQWPILAAWSKQRQWPVNGSLVWLSGEEWKDILTCGFEGETNPRISPGINGGMVMLGRRTSRYGKKRFSEWLDYLNAISAEQGIRIPAPEQERLENTREMLERKASNW